jgi:hypothetical protein
MPSLALPYWIRQNSKVKTRKLKVKGEYFSLFSVFSKRINKRQWREER